MSAAAREQPLLLVADDNPVNLEVLSDALVAQGYDVVVAADGEMVLEQVRCERPDLILLDAIMPGVDGFEACRQLKEDPATREIPIIFMTALTDVEHKLRGLRLGAVDYLVKPFEHEEVLLRIKTHLSLRDMTRAVVTKNAELERQIEERVRAEAERAELMRQLEARTEELRIAKETLERELEVRALMEEERAAYMTQIIDVQAERLRVLSTPLIPVTDWLVVMPLIGAMDPTRAEQVLEAALRGASDRGAEILIFDITGIEHIDEEVAATLLRAAHALGLLGTRVMISGIRAEVARILAEGGIDVGTIVTCSTLQAGIERAFRARRRRPSFSSPGAAPRTRGAP